MFKKVVKSTFLSILFHRPITEGFRKVFNLEIFDDVQHEAKCYCAVI
jgi:hypothetical protein